MIASTTLVLSDFTLFPSQDAQARRTLIESSLSKIGQKPVPDTLVAVMAPAPLSSMLGVESS